MKTEEARVTIYLDIETFASWDKPPLIPVPLNNSLKDEVKIEEDKQKKAKKALENQDESWRKQALDSVQGQVWCVGLAINDEPAFCLIGETEEATLIQLDNELKKYAFPTLIGFNIIEFDGLWLFRRGLKYGLENVVSTFSDKNLMRDVMVLLKGPSYKSYISLDNAAKLFKIEGKGDITGADVHDLVLAKRSQDICDYCCEDVELTRKVYKKLHQYGLG